MPLPPEHLRTCPQRCGQKIVWAVTHVKRDRTEDSKPLDPVPSEAGKFTLARDGDKYVATELKRPGQLAGARAHGVPLYTSHGMTCPKRDEWLRTKGRGKAAGR
jgi:hypothetical protein